MSRPVVDTTYTRPSISRNRGRVVIAASLVHHHDVHRSPVTGHELSADGLASPRSRLGHHRVDQLVERCLGCRRRRWGCEIDLHRDRRTPSATENPATVSPLAVRWAGHRTPSSSAPNGSVTLKPPWSADIVVQPRGTLTTGGSTTPTSTIVSASGPSARAPITNRTPAPPHEHHEQHHSHRRWSAAGRAVLRLELRLLSSAAAGGRAAQWHRDPPLTLLRRPVTCRTSPAPRRLGRR